MIPNVDRQKSLKNGHLSKIKAATLPFSPFFRYHSLFALPFLIGKLISLPNGDLGHKRNHMRMRKCLPRNSEHMPEHPSQAEHIERSLVEQQIGRASCR